MQRETCQRNIIQRLFGICATKKPVDEGCWSYVSGKITIDLARAPELGRPNGAIRLRERVFLNDCL